MISTPINMLYPCVPVPGAVAKFKISEPPIYKYVYYINRKDL
jgi:hypothetical protein